MIGGIECYNGLVSERNSNTATIRDQLHTIIFEADTLSGKLFDIGLIGAILVSVLIVMMDSVAPLRASYGRFFTISEWFFTLLFTVEYILRLICVKRPVIYAKSFFGIVDLLAVLPTYLSFILPASRYLLVIRVLRVLRIFRVLKLVQYLGEARLLLLALKASRRKIAVFLFTVFTVVIIVGSFMYILEGEIHGFSSIPRSIYWAIVTLTTVGYGDISPQTAPGQALAALIMILGYGIIAVPTGIVGVELARVSELKSTSTQVCAWCGLDRHEDDAVFCRHCGREL